MTKRFKRLPGKMQIFAITTRFVQAGKNWARETPPTGCFVQDVALGVSLAKCQRLGGRTAKANQNQNKVTLGGVKQHEWKNSFFTHLVLIDSRGQGKVFVMKIKINSCYSRLSEIGTWRRSYRMARHTGIPFLCSISIHYSII